MRMPVRLTAIQIRTLDLIAAGHTAAEIARIEGVSEATVKTRRHHVRRKLGLVGERTHTILLEWMAQNGWDVAPHLLCVQASGLTVQ